MGAAGFVFLTFNVNDFQGRPLILFAEVSLRSFVPGQHGCPGAPPLKGGLVELLYELRHVH